jgi:uncharacterized protein YbbK (DUF523 family)
MIVGIFSIVPMTASAVPATSGTCGANATWVYDTENTTLTISGTGMMAYYAYSSLTPWSALRSSITKVVINDGITTISQCAFGDCTKLEDVTIPNSVTKIFNSAFAGCTSLEEITIPSSVDTIGFSAFYNCGYYNNEENWVNGVLYNGNYLLAAKTTISGEYTVKSGTYCIAYCAFENCKDLTNIILPNSLRIIGNSAFSMCDGLTSVNIPYGVTTLDRNVFQYCKNLKTIVVPGSVTYVEQNAFVFISNLETVFYEAGSAAERYFEELDDDSIECIVYDHSNSCGNSAYWAYDDNTNTLRVFGSGAMTNYTRVDNNPTSPWFESYGESIESVIIYPGITRIGSCAFFRCPNLANLTISEGVKSIGARSFQVVNKITELTIPDSVETIEQYAFCSSPLTTINVGTGLKSVQDNVFGYETNENGVVNIKDMDAWLNISFVSRYSNPLYQAHNLYLNGNLVKELNFADLGVGNIKQYSFCYCDSLEKVILPTRNGYYDNIRVNQAAFMYCSNLKSITYSGEPDNYTYFNIGNFAFDHCTSLSDIDDITTRCSGIGEAAFQSCSSLSTVKLNCGSIGRFAFWNCYDLQAFVLRKTTTFNTNYGFDAFAASADIYSYKDTPIEDICLKRNLKFHYLEDVGDSAYCYYDEDTKTVTIDGAGEVTSTPWNEAEYVEDIKNVVVCDGITALPDNAFDGLTNLQNTAISDSVETFGNNIFGENGIDTTVYGHKGSSIETYCASNNIDFEQIYTTDGKKDILIGESIEHDAADAAWLNYDLTNLNVLGVQKKANSESNDMRFVAAVNNDIIQDADEYGFIVAKSGQADVAIARGYAPKAKYGEDENCTTIDCKGTSNKISGDFGAYEADTPYKYVTLTIENVPDNQTLVVRFYVKKGDNIWYSRYQKDQSVYKNFYKGLAVNWDALNNA